MPIGNCFKCEVECFYHEGTMNHDRLCSDCYIPKNPTFGWLLSRYAKLERDISKLQEAKEKFKHNKNGLENWLRLELNFKKAKPVKTKFTTDR